MSQNAQDFLRLGSGLRMVRYAWLLSILGGIYHLFGVGQGWIEDGTPPWLLLVGLAFSAIGLLRCGLGARQPGQRFWIFLSALCVAVGIVQASPGSVFVGYLSGAFCFHIFLILLARNLGCEDSAEVLTRLIWGPFVVGVLALVTALTLQGPGYLLFVLFVILGPVWWLARLLSEIQHLERTLA